MVALLALICFILALFKVSLGGLDLMILGLVFVALHLMWDYPLGNVINRGRV